MPLTPSKRSDISDKLIHFTKGKDGNLDDAFMVLSTIVGERRLKGNKNKIKGNYCCVCFSEAPLANLHGGLVNPDNYSLYSPFGIMFEKKWIYSLGGRPVVYQSEAEFGLLNDKIGWKHVRYEPDGIKPIDFSWEREWRLQCGELKLDPFHAYIVVPNMNWAQKLINKHMADQKFKIYQYSEVVDDDEAELLRKPFPWVFVLLEGL